MAQQVRARTAMPESPSSDLSIHIRRLTVAFNSSPKVTQCLWLPQMPACTGTHLDTHRGAHGDTHRLTYTQRHVQALSHTEVHTQTHTQRHIQVHTYTQRNTHGLLKINLFFFK